MGTALETDVERRRRELGRELAASVWISEAEQRLVVEAAQFDVRFAADAGRFGQPRPAVLPLGSDAHDIGRLTKVALVAFRGAVINPPDVTGENYPAAVAVNASVRQGFAQRYRALAVETEADRVRVETTLLDETDERSDTLTLRGETWIGGDDAEVGEMILRVFRCAQLLQRSGLI